ncbi:MAG: 1-acyl-sn-glycerol-3-phosphate acyltransferase, partial [Deltaproteobacteria bacterium]|nr:1-acyl-sn-glycerol-3-phosphate acyltransferase [Deltaproteobacteria bacterium]
MIAAEAIEAKQARPKATGNCRLPSGRLPPGRLPSWRSRLALGVQSFVVRLMGPITITAIGLIMRWVYGFTFHDHKAIRRRFQAELAAHPGPVLIAANHLTFIDSPILTWGLAPTWWYVIRSSKLPWNVPESRNFAASLPSRALVYLCKCLPIHRGGDRTAIPLFLNKLAYLMERGHIVLMFPEARRSRTSRIDRTHAAHGVGRLVKSVPGTKVLCVYLRGDHQHEYSLLPAKGETFHLATSWLEPRTDKKGLRGSLNLTGQILT